MRTRWHFMTHSRAISATRCVGASSARRRRILRSPKTRTARFCQPDGLCRLILTLGEESLCDICAEHPRFYNEYPDRIEAGSALCCEEAVRLLLERDTPLELIIETDGKCPSRRFVTKFSPFSPGRVRRYPNAWTGALTLGRAAMPDFTLSQIAQLYLGLERLDDEWSKCLGRLGGLRSAAAAGGK